MYIEKLTKKDFKNFASLFNCDVARVEEANNNELYLQFFTGAMGPQPEMWLSDFDLSTATNYKYAEKQLKTQYVHFMYEKFGKKYQADYMANYNQKIEADRII